MRANLIRVQGRSLSASELVEIQKLIEEHLDKHRKRLVEKAAQEIAEDLQKQAILAQSEIVRAWQEREAQENLKLAKALAERDLAKESTE